MASVEDAIIAALKDARPVYVGMEALAESLAVDYPNLAPGWLARAVKGLIRGGWVVAWEGSPVGRAVMLSELTASKMGLELMDGCGLASLRWVPAGTHLQFDAPVEEFRAIPGRDTPPVDTPPAKPAKRGRKPHWDDWEEPPPPDDSPPPKILLGIGIPGWNPRMESGKPPCLVCQGRTLRWREICIGCMRWVGPDSGVGVLKPVVDKTNRKYLPDPSLRGGVSEVR